MSLRLFVLMVSLVGFAPLVSAGLPVSVGGEKLPTLAPILEKATPSVVNIATETQVRTRRHSLFNDPFFRRFFDMPGGGTTTRKRNSLGSGVIIDAAKGYIVTNNHVIDGADSITITLKDGRSLQAEVVGSDPETDVALVRIQADGLTAISLSDSDHLRVGDFVVAIGSPFGLSQTVTSGIVSALGRSGLGIEGYEDFIQTDASINPGNSGGALINLRGELVGINAAILAPGGGNVGIGFAIPVNMVKTIIRQLAESGSVKRGQLGIKTQDLTPQLATAFSVPDAKGVLITRVVKDSPASKAGLKRGDVIVRFNGRSVENADQLNNAVGLAEADKVATLNGFRDGKAFAVRVSLAIPKVSSVAGESINRHLTGATIGEVHIDGKGSLLEILEVRPNTPAARTGIRKGDVITGVNRKRVATLDQLQAMAGDPQGALVINLRRGNSTLFLSIR